jgi:hypothetical protein
VPVSLDGANGGSEFVGDLLVHPASRHKGEDLALPRGEAAEPDRAGSV